MAAGFKSGGRKPGSPNKRTAELAERLEVAGFDPVQVIIEVASDAAASPELRLRAASELLPFLYPRRKAVEHLGAGGAPLQGEITIRLVPAVDGRRAN